MKDNLEEKKHKIREELDKIKYEFKVELPKKIAHARSYGDLKENAEYHAARERQGFLKARIAQLTNQIGELNKIDLNNIDESKVGYGSTVTVLDQDTNDKIEFTFVHPNEVNPSEGKISINSPIGAALNNKSVGDAVEAMIPVGKKRYFIEKIVSLHGNVIEVNNNTR